MSPGARAVLILLGLLCAGILLANVTACAFERATIEVPHV